MLLKEDTHFLLSQFGISEKEIDTFENTPDCYSIVFRSLIWGYSIESELYFLDRIKQIPGSYLDPPCEDYLTVKTSKDFGEVFRAVASELADQALEDLRYKKLSEEGDI